MKRREFLRLVPALPAPALLNAQSKPGPAPIPEPHFPSRLHQFVWRNWELANADRMARVVRATPAAILEVGAGMGLPEKRRLTADQLRRIYITVIRQNWHLLPENQIIELLGWNQEQFAFTLKEDDFLDVKLGVPKPECPELVYSAPTAEERARAAEIRKTVEQAFGAAIRERGEERFHFVAELSDPRYAPVRDPAAQAATGEIDLSAGWAIAEPADARLARAAKRLSEYFESAMGTRVPVAAAGDKLIRLDVDASAAPEAEGFRMAATPTAIRIAGHDPAGVMQAIYTLRDHMDAREAPFLAAGETIGKPVWNPRYLYSYFALYGDPLMEPEADPFPDAYLERLAACGINGVWIQGVLNTLAPAKAFPEFGAGCEMRLKNLNALVKRAGQFGVKVFMYLNEPRAMPDAFFRNHPEIRGSSHLNLWAMCTSTPVVRDWIAASLAHVVERVPELGGFFSITVSENHTNCFSHGGGWGKRAPNAGDCPRCTKRQSWDTIGELLNTFREGVRRHSATAEIIAWDWGWGDDLAANLIPLLARDVRFLSLSEWDAPIDRGGVKTTVGEYSISVVGPGPRARRNWAHARKSGISPMAKVQFNNTWEISAVPYIPVPPLILEHCDNLSHEGVTGLMASWTCGGYPSPNLAAAKAYYVDPRRSRDEILMDVAARRYGKAAAADAVAAWQQFSRAFQEYPYGVHVYVIPTQHGPANPLRLEPTGYKPGMILFPHDAYKVWSGRYPPEAVQKQFAKMAAMWGEGIGTFERAMRRVPARRRRTAEIDLAIVHTCRNHFQSTANQVEFYMLRDNPGGAAVERMKAIAKDEIELARRQFLIARGQSIVAYEATNHYYYTPLDLVEKVLNCRQVLRELEARGTA